nr:hypothetical protein CFP56_17996 [Quercus suber]
MPLGFLYQVLLGLDLKDFNFYRKIWSKSASGQIATNTGCFRSRKFLTGEGVMQVFSKIGVGSLVRFYNALLIQHPVKNFGKTSSGG